MHNFMHCLSENWLLMSLVMVAVNQFTFGLFDYSSLPWKLSQIFFNCRLLYFLSEFSGYLFVSCCFTYSH